MANNLRKFNTSADYSAATLVYPAVSYVVESDNVIFDKTAPPPHDYSQDYLTFVALEDGTFNWYGSETANCLSYSTDGGATWSTPSQNITTSTISSGDTVMWKGVGPFESGMMGVGNFNSSGNFNVQGNIMSLQFGDNFANQTDLTGYDSAFSRIFTNGKLISAENLILPATTLSNGCYSYMFIDCHSLVAAPVLPATTLAQSCYEGMFNNCYVLNNIICLATDISAYGCTGYWVWGIAANGTFTKAASMTSWTTGDSGIPSGWTVQDYAE